MLTGKLPCGVFCTDGEEMRKTCMGKAGCLDLQRSYGPDVKPVCPFLRGQLEKLSVRAVTGFSPPPKQSALFPRMAIDTLPSDVPSDATAAEDADAGPPKLARCVRKVLSVLLPLARLRPTYGVIAFCAHRENFLTEWLAPVAEDLFSLPKLLEKEGFRDSAQRCETLWDQMRGQEWLYTCHAHGRGSYLKPPDNGIKDGAHFSFVKWQQRQVDSVKSRHCLNAHEMARLVSPYPARAIGLAEKLVEELAPIPEMCADNEPEIQFVFKNEGATWRIIYEGHETTVKDSLAMRYISFLLEHPNTPFECRDIERACSTEAPEGGRRLDSGEAMEAGLCTSQYDLKQLDDWEAKDIEKAVNKLQEDIKSSDDPVHRAELQERANALRDHLRKNLNRRGKPRSIDDREKARKRLGNAMSRAKRNITAANEEIGQHFEVFVKARGTAFVYEPHREINWTM